MYLIVLTVHVLTLTVFVGTALMLDLRLLGMTMMRVPASEVIARLLPWTTAGFLVMISSGALLFYAAPMLRTRTSSFGENGGARPRRAERMGVSEHCLSWDSREWDLDRVPPRRARVAGDLAGVMGNLDHVGPHDPLSVVLVRLQQAAAIGHRQRTLGVYYRFKHRAPLRVE